MVVLSISSFAFAQHIKDDSQAPEPRSERVVNGLLPNFVMTDTKAMNLAARMEFYNVPGVSIAVIEDGKIAWSRGFGVRNTQTKASVNANTVFQSASISKPVTALGALRMVELKQLHLDVDVNLSLRSWQVPASEFTATEKVTLRRLLSHSAGLSVSGFPGYAFGVAIPTAKQVLEGAQPANTPEVRPVYVPKSKVEYSGGGFTVVQQLMMDVADRSFDRVMAELVLNPIGMSHSSFEQPLALKFKGNAAAGHDGKAEVIPGLYRTHPELAAAGLWTTSADLGRFVIAVQNAHLGAAANDVSNPQHASKILSPPMVLEMLTIQSWPYGLGFVIEGEGSASRFSHRGSNFGYQCILIGFKNKNSGLVVLTNGNNGNGLIQEIVRAVATEYQWPALAPKRYDVKVLASAQHEQYAGYFTNNRGQQLRVRQHNGQLIGQSTDGWTQLVWLGNDQFALVDQQAEISFTRDTAIKISGASVLKESQQIDGFTKSIEPLIPFEAQPFFLRGSLNNWGLTNPMLKTLPDTFVTRIALSTGFVEFKVATQNFDTIDLGALPDVKPTSRIDELALVSKGTNIQMIVEQAGTYEFLLVAKTGTDPKLSVRRLN